MKRIQRVYRGVLFADELLVDKTVRECLKKGFYDGRYQGYVQGRSPFHAPMIPISSLWYDDPRARDFSVHHYRLGFWYGQLRTLPAGHMPPVCDTDLGPHQDIARVSSTSTYLHYVHGFYVVVTRLRDVLPGKVLNRCFSQRFLVCKGGEESTHHITALPRWALLSQLSHAASSTPKGIQGIFHVNLPRREKLVELLALLELDGEDLLHHSHLVVVPLRRLLFGVEDNMFSMAFARLAVSAALDGSSIAHISSCPCLETLVGMLC